MAKKRDRPSQVLAPLTVNTTHTPLSFKHLLAVVILIASAVIVYHPSLKIPFLLDDYGKIIRNPDIKSLANIPSRLVYPYGSPPEFHRNDPSRPFTYLTLTLNYHFSQLEPYGYHVVNIALHVIVVLLIFLLGLLIFSRVGIGGIALPFLSALLFAVHPINVNVVSYVIGRAASLATAFYVLAVILFIKARQGVKGGVVGSTVCFIFALASNQLALTLPAVILIADFCFFSERDGWRIARNWKQHGIYWGILLAYLSMRFAYFGTLGDVEATIPVCDRTRYLLTEWVVLWKYAGMIFWPSGLSFEHLYGPLERLTEPNILVATALYGILLVIMIRGLKSSWQSARLGLFGVLWFLITVSPTSSLFPTTATMAENRVYLPSIGICLIIVFIGNALIRRIVSENSRVMVLVTLFAIYIISLGYLTYHRNVLYQDPVRIWSDIIRKYPTHERAHKNLAIEYFKKGMFNEMAEECKKALSLDPGDFDARNNLAAAYYNLERYNDALSVYQEIVRKKPDYAAAYSNMGLVYERLSDTKNAILAYRNAIRLDSTLIESLNNLAGLYLDQGQIREASALFEAALQIDPNNSVILKNYQRIRAKRGVPQKLDSRIR